MSSACGHIIRSGHDDVARLEGPGRGLGEERRVEHEVLAADDRRTALAEQARDVAAGEPAADDERPAACLAWSRSRAPLSRLDVFSARSPRPGWGVGHPPPAFDGTEEVRACLCRMCADSPRRRSGRDSVTRRWRVQIAVIGSGADAEAAAEEVGRLLAERGATVVTGGLGEVMAAACRGAKAAGGRTVGIVPGTERGAANEWVDVAVATGHRARAEPGRRRVRRRRDRGRRQLGHARRDRLRANARPAGRHPRSRLEARRRRHRARVEPGRGGRIGARERRRLTRVPQDLDARRALALERCDRQIHWYTKNGIWAGVLYRVFQTSTVLLGCDLPRC